MTAYYNEIDPKAAAWLRELIKEGHITPGIVDERSIEDVKPDELREFTQCHFFAGIGVWSYALRRAGWPDDKPVWTGSCPCQPFSAAGKSAGFADERHLWPAWFHLIAQCQPDHIFGEQVASKDGLGWLDLVQADLEAAQYPNSAVDLGAAGVGSPHLRQRLWFVAERLADAGGARPPEQFGERVEPQRFTSNGVFSGLADTEVGTLRAFDREPKTGIRQEEPNRGHRVFSGLAKPNGPGQQPGRETPAPARQGGSLDSTGGTDRPGRPGSTNGFWGAADWLFCRDEKWRPVEPGTSPLVDGAAARVVRLRGYGNAVNAEAAKTFIESYLEVNEL